MGNVLFTNVRIIDGSGAAPFAGEVLVQGNRIRRVGRGAARGARRRRHGDRCRRRDADAGHGRGAHPLLAGTTPPRSTRSSACRSRSTCCGRRNVAKRYLEAGFTSCVGAACAKARLDVVTRNAINEGLIPGPRYLAASQEITVAGGLGDETLPHLPWPEFSFGMHRRAAPRRCARSVRMFLKYGVDSIKLNLSGDNFVPGAPRRHHLDDRRGSRDGGEGDARCAASASRRTRAPASRSSRRCATASRSSTTRASPTRKRSTCSRRTRTGTSSRPGIAILYAMLNEARGVRRQRARRVGVGYQIEWDAALESLSKMHKRGIRVLPGGDYGFAMTPHCQNARDLQFFVKYLGMTPMEAIVSATQVRRPDHDARQRAGRDQGRLPRRPAAGRRRSAGQPRDPARPEAHARGDEGRRVLQDAGVRSCGRASRARRPDHATRA